MIWVTITTPGVPPVIGRGMEVAVEILVVAGLADSLIMPPPRTPPSTFGTTFTTPGRAEVIGFKMLVAMPPTGGTYASSNAVAEFKAFPTLGMAAEADKIEGSAEATIVLIVLTTPFMTAGIDITRGTAIAVASLTLLGIRPCMAQ
jgi:hypothetical protein